MNAEDPAPDLGGALAALLSELLDGPPEREAYMLNRGDAGLLASLDAVTWERAGAPGIEGGASIAQHADHLRYGLSLMNRWVGGETNPFASADWAASWRVSVSSDGEWRRIRDGLAEEARRWIDALRAVGDTPPAHPMALKGMIGSIGHLGYHLGAIRQIAAEARGPREGTA